MKKTISKNNNMNGVILFLEHNSIYTLGRNADTSNVLPTKSLKIIAKSLKIIEIITK